MGTFDEAPRASETTPQLLFLSTEPVGITMPPAPVHADLAAFLPFLVAEIHFSPSLAKTTRMDAQWIPDGQEEHALSFSSSSPRLPPKMQL